MSVDPYDDVRVLLEVTPGEAFDRWSIAMVKAARLMDGDAVSIAKAEASDISVSVQRLTLPADLSQVVELFSCVGRLRQINGALWDLENTARQDDHDPAQFKSIIREIQQRNAERSELKTAISRIFGSSGDLKQYG